MSKETVYDAAIAPLMARIIEICKSHKIAMLANFRLDEDLACSTILLEAYYEPSMRQLRAARILRPEQVSAFAEMIETLPDGSKKVSIRRIS